MNIVSYAHQGYNGELVDIDVDIRRGIPGVDIVGLPDGAVREARERIRIALKRSGYEFPKSRILINLAPAGIKKAGAGHDLPMATALLMASGQLPKFVTHTVMILGELHLNGEIRGVNGVLSALICAKERGIERFIIPSGNSGEAFQLGLKNLHTLDNLQQLPALLEQWNNGDSEKEPLPDPPPSAPSYEDFSDIRGQERLKRSLVIAAAGRHNLMLFGPPGCGKTMAARRFPALLGPLTRKEQLEATRIWSIAGKLNSDSPLITHPPVREPHHSSSLEGLVGGGPLLEPGEVSLAHRGILLLDEAPEFGSRCLQSLREPLEQGRVTLSRAGKRFWFPADFQLVLTANPCPCGNLGKKESVCICSPLDISKYWRRIGGALMDRIDMRIPVLPVPAEVLIGPEGTTTFSMKEKLAQAGEYRDFRTRGDIAVPNGRLDTKVIRRICGMEASAESLFPQMMMKFRLTSRAAHSVLKIARTVADLDEKERIEEHHLLEAVYYRRYGEEDLYWISFR